MNRNACAFDMDERRRSLSTPAKAGTFTTKHFVTRLFPRVDAHGAFQVDREQPSPELPDAGAALAGAVRREDSQGAVTQGLRPGCGPADAGGHNPSLVEAGWFPCSPA